MPTHRHSNTEKTETCYNTTPVYIGIDHSEEGHHGGGTRTVTISMYINIVETQQTQHVMLLEGLPPR